MTKHKSQDERRAQILKAAKTCFIQKGFAHTRVDDIARAAGLSKGGVYFHFKSKRKIFDALFEAQQATTAALVAEVEASDDGIIEKITQLGTILMRNFADGDRHGKFLIVLAEMGIRDPEVYKRVADSHNRYIDVLARYIEQGVEAGEVRNVNARMAALMLKFLTDGVEQGLALGYEFDNYEFVATALDVLFNGLRPAAPPS